MSEITNFQMACSARRYLLNRAAEAATYDWSNDFSSKYIKEWSVDFLKCNGAQKINIDDLSLDEMKELGFSRWDESGLMLIPLWICAVANDLDVICIDGTTGMLSASDRDVRFCCIAHGVMPR